MSLDCNKTIIFRFKSKLEQKYCWFGYFTVAEQTNVNCWSASVIRKRIFFGFLLSLIFLVISSSSCGCLKPVNALEHTNSPSLFDNIDKSSSIGDYEDYGENIESDAEKADTNLNTNDNQTPLQPVETDEHTAKHIDDNDGNDVERNPSEIQKAVCTITAGEVRASAEAVTTKTLKGVCGSAELQLALGNLEMKIFKELESLKTLLIQQIAAFQQSPQNCAMISPESTAKPPAPTPSSQQPPSISLFKTVKMPEKKIIPDHHDENKNVPKIKSLPTSQQNAPSLSRDKEVFKFNNTMLADKDVKVFTYYWRLENFTARIESGQSITIDSPRFAIKGKRLHLKAYFQHLHRDFLFVQLEYATMTKSNIPNHNGSSNNIILDMGLLGGGSLFKAISSNDQILFKYKISILDQQNLRSSKDLISQEFHNLDGGFLIPNSALLGSSYIKDDTLLIQLFLYL